MLITAKVLRATLMQTLRLDWKLRETQAYLKITADGSIEHDRLKSEQNASQFDKTGDDEANHPRTGGLGADLAPVFGDA